MKVLSHAEPCPLTANEVDSEKGVLMSNQSNREEIDIGSEKVVIQRRYKALGAFNDLLITVWFPAGSILFFFDSLMTGEHGCLLPEAFSCY